MKISRKRLHMENHHASWVNRKATMRITKIYPCSIHFLSIFHCKVLPEAPPAPHRPLRSLTSQQLLQQIRENWSLEGRQPDGTTAGGEFMGNSWENSWEMAEYIYIYEKSGLKRIKHGDKNDAHQKTG